MSSTIFHWVVSALIGFRVLDAGSRKRKPVLKAFREDLKKEVLLACVKMGSRSKAATLYMTDFLRFLTRLSWKRSSRRSCDLILPRLSDHSARIGFSAGADFGANQAFRQLMQVLGFGTWFLATANKNSSRNATRNSSAINRYPSAINRNRAQLLKVCLPASEFGLAPRYFTFPSRLLVPKIGAKSTEWCSNL